jgi:hypothetical protein
MPLTSSSWAIPRRGSPAASPASRSNTSTSSPAGPGEGLVEVASLTCPVFDSYGADAVDRMRGPYVSQYASSPSAQRGRLMDPVSQRLTFGCEAVATPNSTRRIRAHASISCPAYSRATWSCSRWASPQATSTSGRLDTTIVLHTHIQGVYASRSYYTYVTYIAVAAHAIRELPRRQPTDPWRSRVRECHLRSTLPDTGTRTACRPQRRRRLAGATHLGVQLADSRPDWSADATARFSHVERVRNTGLALEITAVKFRARDVHRLREFPQDVIRIIAGSRRAVIHRLALAAIELSTAKGVYAHSYPQAIHKVPGVVCR